MHKRIPAACLFFCFIGLSTLAQLPQVQKLDDGVLIALNNSRCSVSQNIRIEVVADNIIHVTSAVPGSANPRPSLMRVDTLRKRGGWKMSQQGETVTIRTSQLNANVSLSTGVVSFTDTKGNPIIGEVPRQSDAFIPSSYGGDSFYRLSQAFVVDDKDAFYGLGQHQNDVINYRGRQVILSQYNTDVAVPFVVSNRNYGILWDNYSITKAGDVREQEPLSHFRLYSADGQDGWLTATYSPRDSSGGQVVRAESEIDYSFLKDMKKFPEGFNAAGGKVRWEGAFDSPYDGTHTFFFKYAGYVKIWMDGKLVADRWRQPWNAGAIEFQYDLRARKRYPIKIEWMPDGSESYLSMKWLSPVPEGKQHQFAFSSEAGDQIDYYFIKGSDIDEVIGGYRTLTGRAPIVPKWAMGFWQSRERYKTQDEILNTVKTFRDKKIPLDNIVLDWSYWPEDQWGSQQFDPGRFPDPGKMISLLHDRFHTHFMISVWPKFYKGIEAYNEMEKNGWLYMRNIQDGRRDWIGKGYFSTFYDPFNSEARSYFWKLIRDSLYKKGVDAWWLDATEPDIHSNLDLDTRKTLMSPSIGSGVRYFNAFALENARGIYEGQRKTHPDRRVFILTRSSYGGQQRYAAATWSGDISSRWHDMKDQISAGINFSLSGLPYWTMDIGGFSVERRFEKAKGEDLEEWRELNTRWYQFGAFVPLFRSHGQYPYREIFNIAPENHSAYRSILYYDQLRYRLLPYVYSLAGKAFHQNYTMMRGLIMDFASDSSVVNIGDQYMFGPSLLINPVYQYKASSRSVYLPGESGWYDLYSGKYLNGRQRIEAPAPYEKMPVYVKEGAIIPVGPDMQYTSEKQADPLTLYVYTGKDGSFELYEDEGNNYNYEKGAFTVIKFDYDEKSNTLNIKDRRGAYKGMLKSRTFYIVKVQKGTPVGFGQLPANKTKVRYTGKAISLKL